MARCQAGTPLLYFPFWSVFPSFSLSVSLAAIFPFHGRKCRKTWARARVSSVMAATWSSPLFAIAAAVVRARGPSGAEPTMSPSSSSSFFYIIFDFLNELHCSSTFVGFGCSTPVTYRSFALRGSARRSTISFSYLRSLSFSDGYNGCRHPSQVHYRVRKMLNLIIDSRVLPLRTTLKQLLKFYEVNDKKIQNLKAKEDFQSW